jgi:small acid-soluble spore protein (thioredoxin-like protein)
MENVKSSRPNPDNREDNVEKIQKNIDMTIRNMEASEELIAKTSDENMKKTLTAKNERRREALDGMRREIRDEAEAKEQGKS